MVIASVSDEDDQRCQCVWRARKAELLARLVIGGVTRGAISGECKVVRHLGECILKCIYWRFWGSN
jgi:hypothetical protein